MKVRALIPLEDTVKILDQTRLPKEMIYNEYGDYRDIVASIKKLEIRGAPAIGIAGAYALAIAARADVDTDVEHFKRVLTDVASEIKDARPTAANLAWAVNRVLNVAHEYQGDNKAEFAIHLWDEAGAILKEDEELCNAIGRHGEELIKDGDTILTHCNAGILATGGMGTALAVIYAAHERGKRIRVYADETRPLLQGARLTAWELQQAGIEVVLNVDSASGILMRQGRISCVILGADRIAQNGDIANKIGTYNVAVLARHHRIPFYVAAPYSTFDRSLETGDDIPIEERSPEEVVNWGGIRIAPEGVDVYSPAFDITPHELISAYITDKGVLPGGRDD
ncbi:MAG: S-methyl-5-thioribose-1-phosphate isomerase [Candidatus Zixiibacteriota bacterium]|nr:MAG: S-methyl-5-thioribose-1-phosphate isomerase [candidate division Zixibacteria bacterium]